MPTLANDRAGNLLLDASMAVPLFHQLTNKGCQSCFRQFQEPFFFLVEINGNIYTRPRFILSPMLSMFPGCSSHCKCTLPIRVEIGPEEGDGSRDLASLLQYSDEKILPPFFILKDHDSK